MLQKHPAEATPREAKGEQPGRSTPTSCVPRSQPEGLASFLDKLPIADDALQIVNVRLQATSSPYDLTVRMAPSKDQVERASLAGPKSLIKRVRDAGALAERMNGSASEPAPGVVPEPDAVSDPEPEVEALPALPESAPQTVPEESAPDRDE